MREILFRGYCKEELMGSQWVEGFGVFNCECVDDTEEHLILFGNSGNHEVYSESIGEYIGIEDIHDKKVFEGDIVKVTYDDYSHGRGYLKGVIIKSFCSFELQRGWHNSKPIINRIISECNSGCSHKTNLKFEVIGNIYENPNFLKEQKVCY